jgi:hypothetical protein
MNLDLFSFNKAIKSLKEVVVEFNKDKNKCLCKKSYYTKTRVRLRVVS